MIKEVSGGVHRVCATLLETIDVGQAYNLLLVVSGDTATLKVGGETKVSYTLSKINSPDDR